MAFFNLSISKMEPTDISVTERTDDPHDARVVGRKETQRDPQRWRIFAPLPPSWNQQS